MDANLALYIDTADAESPKEYHNDLPLVRTPPSRVIAIPGDIICELEPEAARVVDAQIDADFVIQTEEACYHKEDDAEELADSDELEYLSPWIIIKSRLQTDADETSPNCMLNIDPEDYQAVIDGTGPHGYAREMDLTEAQCAAFQKIISRLDDIRTRLIDRGLYPAEATAENLLQYRREYEIGKSTLQLVQDAQEAQRQAETRVEQQTARLHQEADKQLKLQTEARLRQVPTIGVADKQVTDSLNEALSMRSDSGIIYSGISRSEVEELRIAVVDQLLVRNQSLYLFNTDDVQRVARAFHSSGTFQTNVEAISIKAESSKNGPVVTFTISKDYLTGNGLHKSVSEAYIFCGNSYIKSLTTIDTVTGTGTKWTHNEQPLNRVQRDAFIFLLEAIPPKEPPHMP